MHVSGLEFRWIVGRVVGAVEDGLHMVMSACVAAGAAETAGCWVGPESDGQCELWGRGEMHGGCDGVGGRVWRSGMTVGVVMWCCHCYCINIVYSYAGG